MRTDKTAMADVSSLQIKADILALLIIPLAVVAIAAALNSLSTLTAKWRADGPAVTNSSTRPM